MAAPRILAAVLTGLVPVSLGVHVQEVPKNLHPPKPVNPEKIAELEKEWRKKHNITAPQADKSLKSNLGSNSKKVLIIQGNRKDTPVCEWMYGPFVQTIQEGFEHCGTFSVTVPTPTVNFKTSLETEMGYLASGDILVFVGGVGKGTFLDVMYAGSNPATSLVRESSSAAAASFRDHASRYNFSGLRSNGIKVIYYNTDAAFECPLTGADPVDELWDFSKHNLDNCEEQGNGPATMRYVPPGFIGGPTSATTGAKGSLMHMGHAWWRTCWIELYNKMPGELSFESSAWTQDAMTGLLKHHNIFLNLHKGDCRWERNPFAAVRASRLLSAGTILISEKAYSKDETEFAGLVDFVDFDAINTTYANYFQQDEVTFKNLRESRRSAYMTKFAPSTLFTNANVCDDLS